MKIYLQTCRLCKLSNYESKESLVKYGVRHNAHLSCALTKFGGAFLDRLHSHQIAQLPFMILKEHGLLEEARRRVAIAKKS